MPDNKHPQNLPSQAHRLQHIHRTRWDQPAQLRRKLLLGAGHYPHLILKQNAQNDAEWAELESAKIRKSIVLVSSGSKVPQYPLRKNAVGF